MRYLIACLCLILSLVDAADITLQQKCYKICVHNKCNKDNKTTICASGFVTTWMTAHDGNWNGSGREATYASICTMAPQGTNEFDESEYECKNIN
ncbi:hypothetical protein GQ42DRAFT_161602 [Ramicandelaber brevisporus]|nr:hypothetical protein GQ42DRAFT_161602 [Ramicandelaber brevisporus]